MGNIQLGPVGSYINLTDNTGYDYTFAETINRHDSRVKQGQLYTYIQDGSWYKFKLPASWINSSYRSLINSWWRTATDLRFYEDSDQPNYFAVRIMTSKEPFQKFRKPYFQTYYEGEIILETISGVLSPI